MIRIKKFFLLPIALLFVIFIILLSPFLLIRFFHIKASRIAHLVLEPELYLCKKEKHRTSQRYIDFFYSTDKVSNEYLLRKWRQTLPYFLPRSCTLLTVVIIRLLTLMKRERHVITPPVHEDTEGLLHDYSPHIHFSDSEKKCAKINIEKMGIEGQDYVCVLARDSAYLANHLPNIDSSYHDYRDFDIINCIPALKELSVRNVFSIRMGVFTEKKLPEIDHRIIDYASFHRTDFMDIYLSANCKFMVCSTSGLYGVARVFNRPLVIVNMTPLNSYMFMNRNGLFLPKMAMFKGTDRIMNFRELLYFRPDIKTDSNIELLESKPEDIQDVVLEMDQRLNGTWEASLEDENLQRAFWTIMEKVDVYRPPNVRISAMYLRKNSHLL